MNTVPNTESCQPACWTDAYENAVLPQERPLALTVCKTKLLLSLRLSLRLWTSVETEACGSNEMRQPSKRLKDV
jgi:hypothetical protein